MQEDSDFHYFLAIAIPIIEGKVDVPTNLTIPELISFAKQVWTFWVVRIKSVIPSIVSLIR
ncbi:hypothetical protein Arcpr_0612 [Archaeoglobus profundus DSM 5631]|uniref:Uncharacterized protein n=1 Tax=Archaeoglobus profundus (strain DSM 5631 / JCM 9629 / NBRC 100127 / Av18) TaxID=572546 RepID=D2RHA2_ARCPA|nr:hypothetical protein Arcpr_0612 [Archaeoglobus profundus DSM 5631]